MKVKGGVSLLQQETLDRAKTLDKEYFGDRELKRLIEALAVQVRSMQEEPTKTNYRKQMGDIMFILASFERNTGWELDELLNDALVKIEARRKRRHYYEAHVTIEPVFGERLQEFAQISKKFGFHVAELLMQKRKEDTPERSAKDSFCTGRSISRSDIEYRADKLVDALLLAGFQVWRHKIEETLSDSRYEKDTRLQEENLPDKEKNPRPPADGALAGKDGEEG